jgi:hypothetical protein
MQHLFRAGGLLAAVVVLTAVAIALPRVVAVPEVMDDYGLYRGTDNSAEWADWTGQYLDQQVCDSCHADNHGSWAGSKHSGVSCESCHGPGKAHVEDGASLIIDTSRDFCALCHAEIIGRPAGFPQVDTEIHGGQSDCVKCHDPHGTEFRTDAAREVPHSLEGIADCLECHATGKIMPYAQDHEGLDTGTCLYCHGGE